MPLVEWIVNLLMCLATWGLLSLVAKFLQSRKLWNDTMTVACFLWILTLRFRDPRLILVPMTVFALGLFIALGDSRYNIPSRLLAAAVGSMLWFHFAMWNVVAVMFYFCSGCFFMR